MSFEDYLSNHSPHEYGNTKRKTNIDGPDYKRKKDMHDHKAPPSGQGRANGGSPPSESGSSPPAPRSPGIDQHEEDELSRVNWSAGRRRTANGLLTCLSDRRRLAPGQPALVKKRVRFVSEARLVDTRYFEEDDEEKAQRENVYKTKLLAEKDGDNMKKREMKQEKATLNHASEMESNDHNHKSAVDENPWLAPPRIAKLVPPLVERGRDSVDKMMLLARQAINLSALFLDRENLPESPDEPSEIPPQSEGKLVALVRPGMDLSHPPVDIVPKGPLLDVPAETPAPVVAAPPPTPGARPAGPVSFSLNPSIRPGTPASGPHPGFDSRFSPPHTAPQSGFSPINSLSFAAGAANNRPQHPEDVGLNASHSPTNAGMANGFRFPPPALGKLPNGIPAGFPEASRAQGPISPRLPSHSPTFEVRANGYPEQYAQRSQMMPPLPNPDRNYHLRGPGPPYQGSQAPPVRTCLFYSTPAGCRQGSHCRYLHINPPPSVNQRRY